jgi:hypothetical protein
MSQKITCYTLFNIEQTGITSRHIQNESIPDWIKKRNTQTNFDTIIQVISLRTQPENISIPIPILASTVSDFFGTDVQLEKCVAWKFTFEISYAGAYRNETDELGNLHNDCEFVPMIEVERQYEPSNNFLDCSSELRNIYFEVTDD